MATTTGSFKLYYSFTKYIADGTIDLDTDTFNVTLHTASYGSVDTTHQNDHTVYANLTNELTTANGYTAGGQALAGVTFTRSVNVSTFKCTSPSWTVATANLVAYYFIIRKVGTANGITDPLVGVGYLDATGNSVATVPGDSLTISTASGIFNIFTG